MACGQWDMESVLAELPPIPVSLYVDHWTRERDTVGRLVPSGNNPFVVVEERGRLVAECRFSWAAILQALNAPRKDIRLPLTIGQRERLPATPLS